MQIVTAILRPHKLDSVKEALKSAGVQGMTVTEVKGFGRQGGHTETYRGAEYRIDLIPKIKVEVIAETTQVEHIVETIIKAGQTGKIGDGKVWVTPLTSVMRVRTEESGIEAV